MFVINTERCVPRYLKKKKQADFQQRNTTCIIII